MTKRNITILATLATLVAAPAFAMDQDTAAVTINSGRYFGEQINYVPAGAHASVYGSARNQSGKRGDQGDLADGRHGRNPLNAAVRSKCPNRDLDPGFEGDRLRLDR